jgi:ketosteroid isomerase-like protein
MTAPVARSIVEAFYAAYISRDPQRIGALLDDDVEWQVSGPAEVMQVCGLWQGKAAVIDRFECQMPKIIDFKSLQIDHLLVDGDHSAMFGRITCVQRQTGRLISHGVAHVVRYYDGKVINFRVINDSLDAAEQFIGHHIDLTGPADPAGDDLVAV